MGRDALNKRPPSESTARTCTAKTTTTSQVADCPSLGDLTNMRTLESGGRPAYLVSSFTSQVARATLRYPETEASSSVQVDIQDHFSDRADPFNTAGENSGMGILRRTTTTISRSSNYSHSQSQSGTSMSYSGSHTAIRTSGIPLASQLLCLWLVLCVPFCSQR